MDQRDSHDSASSVLGSSVRYSTASPPQVVSLTMSTCPCHAVPSAHGAKAVLSKYGTLLIRDFAMNTLLHLAVERAEDSQCVYLLRCLQSIGGVPVMSQVCGCGSASAGYARQSDSLTMPRIVIENPRWTGRSFVVVKQQSVFCIG
jgi:hypothetical protein